MTKATYNLLCARTTSMAETNAFRSGFFYWKELPGISNCYGVKGLYMLVYVISKLWLDSFLRFLK